MYGSHSLFEARPQDAKNGCEASQDFLPQTVMAVQTNTAPVGAFQAEFPGREATKYQVFYYFATVVLGLEGLDRGESRPENFYCTCGRAQKKAPKPTNQHTFAA